VGVYAISESGRVNRVVDAAETWLKFAEEKNLVLEGVFVFNPKGEEFVLVVQDVLVSGGEIVFSVLSFQERFALVEKFVKSVTDAGNSPILVVSNHLELLSKTAALTGQIFWQPETEARVFIRQDLRLPVIGIRVQPLSAFYTPGSTNDCAWDWHYPRQSPLWLLGGMQGQVLLFSFHDSLAGKLIVNPSHVPAILEEMSNEETQGQCIVKMDHDPTKGLFNVRGVFAANSGKALTTASQCFLSQVHSLEAIAKDEFLSWVGPPPAAKPAQKKK
jgi:hypothetical protein